MRKNSFEMNYLEVEDQNLVAPMCNENKIEVILEQLLLLEELKQTIEQQIEELHKQITPLILQKQN